MTVLQMRGSEAVLCELVFETSCIPFLHVILAGPDDPCLKVEATHLLAALCSLDEAKDAAVCPALRLSHKTCVRLNWSPCPGTLLDPLADTVGHDLVVD